MQGHRRLDSSLGQSCPHPPSKINHLLLFWSAVSEGGLPWADGFAPRLPCPHMSLGSRAGGPALHAAAWEPCALSQALRGRGDEEM